MKIFSILKKDLLILLRDRAEMAVLFLMPLAFILPISFALGAGDGYGINSDNRMIALPVVDYDQGPRAQALQTSIGESLRLEKELEPGILQDLALADDPDCALPVPETTPTASETPTAEPTGTPDAPESEITATLESTPVEEEIRVSDPACLEKAGREMLRRSWRSAMLIIPEGFSDSVDAGEPIEVTLLFDPAGDSIEMQQIEGVIKGATIKISLQNQVDGGISQLNDLAILAPADVRQSISKQTNDPPLPNQQAALRIEKTSPSNYKARLAPDTYQQTIPGYTVMFVFFIITTLTSSIYQERLLGTFRRLLSAPVSRAELLGGKLLASMTIGLAQVFILFAVGALVFKLGLGNDPLAFFLLTVTLVAVATSLGLAVSTTRVRGGGAGVALIISALLGGCMFPLDMMPSFLRSLSVLVPHRWALLGYQNLMVRGLGLQEVFPQIIALAIFAAIFFTIALLRFDFESV
jgi:ABC-2 type transport system permease protein